MINTADLRSPAFFVSRAHDMSAFVARKLSGLRWSRMEVTNAADRDATEDTEDAIHRGI